MIAHRRDRRDHKDSSISRRDDVEYFSHSSKYKTDSISNWRTRNDSDVFLKEAKTMNSDRKGGRLKSTALTSSKNTCKSIPSYVPSYVRNVGFECNRPKRSNWTSQTKQCPRASEPSSSRKHRTHSSNGSSSLLPKRDRLRTSRHSSLPNQSEIGE